MADRAVGKRQFKIEHAIAQRNDGARREIDDAEHENGLLRSVWKISTQLAAMDSRIEMHDVSVAKIAVMIHVFFDIRAIGNLNAHGDAQSVDNGSEFADADGIARSAINAEEKRTAVYYCHA